MQTAIANITWWQALLLLFFVMVSILVPIYKSQKIWPFNKKEEENLNGSIRECPADIKTGLKDLRDIAIRIDANVSNANNSISTFRDTMLVMNGEIREMVQTIKEEI